ncbi:MAG: chloride channel protein [Blastopirellula sp. JB062]
MATERLESLPGNDISRHAIGMLAAGVLFYGMWIWMGRYYLEGIGYATIMDVITGKLTDPYFLLILCGLKLLVTCLTLGSGGSGGVFSPALYMGATSGAAFALIVRNLAPGLEIEPVTFALAGMAAGVGASTGAMITSAVMLQEMTNDNNVMMPVIVTTIVACAVRKLISPASIYTLKLLRRGRVVPEGLQAAMDDARSASDVMETQFQVVEDAAVSCNYSGVTIVAPQGKIQQVRHPFGAVDSARNDGDTSFVLVRPQTPLIDAMRQMRQAGASCALVCSHLDAQQAQDVVGVITWRELGDYQTRWAELY